PFMAGVGVESDPCACVSGMVLSLQGNSITISRKLWEQGVQDATALKEKIHNRWGKRTYTFAVIFPFSPQEILLRRWLQSAGVAPDAGVRIISVPPSQMFPMLKLGYIDGFCVSEPWTSLAVQAGSGVCVATSSQLAPLHPEKVLAVRQSFAIGRADEHERLIAALVEACAYCDSPANAQFLSEMLSPYVNAPSDCLASFAHKTNSEQQGLSIFSRYNANLPDDDKARWLMAGLYELLEPNCFAVRDLKRTPVLKNVFRRDIFDRAGALSSKAAMQRPAPVSMESNLSPRVALS
ncbi:MAG TPA: CmpA/NrtA family ABC transporter substrate-binding protein, partial [Terriglobales bacterium]|nr:CmpA/NrtA family ABC transporter substrate-binding protein [Terriglobales bacterium]